MKLIRFEHKGKQDWGFVRDEIIHVLSGDIFADVTETTEKIRLSEVTNLPPVSPSKIIGIGLNYYEHAKKAKFEVPAEPLIFFKPPSSIIGQLDHIIYPDGTSNVAYEGELGIVIGKHAKSVSESQALDYVLGYTIVNDVSSRDHQKKDNQWSRGKGFDTFCPVGPVIVTDIDPDDLNIEIRLNSKTEHSSNTKDLIFKCAHLISFISKVMVLLPGDLIATGTPGTGAIKKGDLVEIEIEKIGVLKNVVS